MEHHGGIVLSAVVLLAGLNIAMALPDDAGRDGFTERSLFHPSMHMRSFLLRANVTENKLGSKAWFTIINAKATTRHCPWEWEGSIFYGQYGHEVYACDGRYWRHVTGFDAYYARDLTYTYEYYFPGRTASCIEPRKEQVWTGTGKYMFELKTKHLNIPVYLQCFDWAEAPPKPEIYIMEPQFGYIDENANVTLVGDWFVPDMSCLFDNLPSEKVTFINRTHAICSAPTHSVAGQTDFKVWNGLPSDPWPWNYLVPGIESILPLAAGPTAGNDVMTIVGSGFGAPGGVVDIRIDGGVCANAVVVSDTRVTCDTPPGSGRDNFICPILAGKVGFCNPIYHYAPPQVTSLNPTSGSPTTGNFWVTILGDNFGPPGDAPGIKATIGGRECITGFTHISHTEIRCKTPEGAGVAEGVQVYVDGQFSNTLNAYSYAKPIVTKISPEKGPITGGQRITIEGSNFGPLGTTYDVWIDGNVCTSPQRVSHDGMSCLTPAGVGRNLLVVVDVKTNRAVANVADLQYDYGDALVTSVLPNGGLTAGGHTVTLRGSNFGSAASTLVVNIDGNVCTAPAWTSETLIECLVPPGDGESLGVLVTVDGLFDATNIAYIYNYGKANISKIVPDSILTTGGTVTFEGINFGGAAAARSARIAGIACAPLTYVSHERLQCTLPAGAGFDQPPYVTVAGLESDDPLTLFSYDKPHVTAVSDQPASGGGAETITLYGSNFGPTGSIQNIKIDGAFCGGATYISHTAVQCDNSPPGEGNGLEVVVTVNGQGGDPTAAGAATFSYASAVIHWISVHASQSAGGGMLAIQGDNFGTGSQWRQIYIGDFVCGPEIYGGPQFLECPIPWGTGMNLTVTVSLGSINSTSPADMMFEYEQPSVDSINPLLGPTEGSPLTLIGTNFGPLGSNGVRINGRDCVEYETTSVTSPTAITCMTPEGTGEDLPIYIDAGGWAITAGTTYAYSAPTLTALAPQTGTTYGGTAMDIYGSSFGPQSSISDITIGGTSCASTPPYTWFSHTHVRCTTIAGQGLNVPVVLTSTGIPTVGGPAWSYTLPSITAISPNTGAGGVNMTIYGDFFGDPSAVVAVTMSFDENNTISCAYPHHFSQTELVCMLPPGGGQNYEIVLQSNNAYSPPSTGTAKFSYTAPAITAIEPTTAESVSLRKQFRSLTLFGTGFGQFDTPREIFVGGSDCPFVSYLTPTSVNCTLPVGYGTGRSVDIYVRGVQDTTTNTLDYLVPKVKVSGNVLTDPTTYIMEDVIATGANLGEIIFTLENAIWSEPFDAQKRAALINAWTAAPDAGFSGAGLFQPEQAANASFTVLDAEKRVLRVTFKPTFGYSISTDEVVTFNTLPAIVTRNNVPIPPADWDVTQFSIFATPLSITLQGSFALTPAVRTESNIRDTGGTELILYLAGDTWAVPPLNNAFKDNVLNAITGSPTVPSGWSTLKLELRNNADWDVDTQNQGKYLTISNIPLDSAYALLGNDETMTFGPFPGVLFDEGSAVTTINPANTLTVTADPTSLALSGTIITGTTKDKEFDVRYTGGATLIYTLTKTKFKTMTGAIETDIMNAITSGGGDWATLKAAILATGTFALNGAKTVLTITFPATSAYMIAADETMTVANVPASAIEKTTAIAPTGTNSFTIDDTPPSLAITGTFISAPGTEDDAALTGGKTLVYTLTNAKFTPAPLTATEKNAIVNAISTGGGDWNTLKAGIVASGTWTLSGSDQVLTITFPAVAAYDISADETLTFNNVPSAATDIGANLAPAAATTTTITDSPEALTEITIIANSATNEIAWVGGGYIDVVITAPSTAQWDQATGLNTAAKRDAFINLINANAGAGPYGWANFRKADALSSGANTVPFSYPNGQTIRLFIGQSMESSIDADEVYTFTQPIPGSYFDDGTDRNIISGNTWTITNSGPEIQGVLSTASLNKAAINAGSGSPPPGISILIRGDRFNTANLAAAAAKAAFLNNFCPGRNNVQEPVAWEQLRSANGGNSWVTGAIGTWTFANNDRSLTISQDGGGIAAYDITTDFDVKVGIAGGALHPLVSSTNIACAAGPTLLFTLTV